MKKLAEKRLFPEPNTTPPFFSQKKWDERQEGWNPKRDGNRKSVSETR